MLALKRTVLPLQILFASATMVIEGVTVVQKTNPVKLPVPLVFVTETLPLAPDPTTAVMVVELTTEKELAATPPKLTAVDPVKFVPVIVTVVPAAAVAGVKEVMVGDPEILIVT